MPSKKEMRKNNLYASFDESNHNNGNDILVSVISVFPEDILHEKFGRRDYFGTRSFLDKKGRDYRFTTFGNISELEESGYKLYLSSIILIKNFLKNNRERFSELNMIFDGPPKNKWKKILEEELGTFQKINVSHYWGNKKKKRYPILLQLADVTASELYRGLCSEILNSKKFVKFSLEEILRLKKRFDII